METEMNGLVQEKLRKLNNGFNFFNLVQTEKKFYIEIELKVEQDLKEREEVINVKTNLDIPNASHSGYWGDYNVVEFLKDLQAFCKKPLAEIKTSNRKEKISSWKLGDIEKSIRKKTIKFSDINISIGKLASDKLKLLGIDFENEVEKILKKQKDIDKETQDKINQYVFLREKMEVLKSLVGYEKMYGSSYGYGYNQVKDNTLKVTLSAEEYNSKLKEIELEIRALEKYFGLRETEMKYVKIEEKVDYKKWLKENEDELRENFEQAKEESGESETTFDEYCEMCFEQDLDNGECEEYEDDEE